jgi:hypothetical protein
MLSRLVEELADRLDLGILRRGRLSNIDVERTDKNLYSATGDQPQALCVWSPEEREPLRRSGLAESENPSAF